MGSGGEVLCLHRCQRPLRTARRIAVSPTARSRNAAAAASRIAFAAVRLTARGDRRAHERAPKAHAVIDLHERILQRRLPRLGHRAQLARRAPQRRPALPPRPAAGAPPRPPTPRAAARRLSSIRCGSGSVPEMPSPPSTRPNGSWGRRSSAFVHQDSAKGRGFPTIPGGALRAPRTCQGLRRSGDGKFDPTEAFHESGASGLQDRFQAAKRSPSIALSHSVLMRLLPGRMIRQ
jgi:hypothetical protein